MARISNEEINAIRSNSNIVEIIGSYIPVTQKGKDYKCVCPFHDDHSPSMSISVSKQIYKCFSCGAAGNVFTFVQNYENVSFIEAVKIVADKIGFSTTNTFEIEVVSKYQKEYDLFKLVNKYYQNNLNSQIGLEAKKYLSERGLNEDIIKDFGIGLSKDDYNALTTFLLKKDYDISMLENLGLTNISNNTYYDTFAKRITFPLCDYKGNIIGYSSRVYRGETDQAKYINTKETYLFKKGQNLFNYHRAKDMAKKSGYIIVVEGQMDAIRVYSTGLKNVVALMGTAMTKEQIELLKNLRAKVILCLDNDEAGDNATLKNGELLIQNNITTQVVRLSGAKDPDEYILKFGAESYQKNIEDPIDYLDYKIKKLKENVNTLNTEELSGYINSVLHELSNSKDKILVEVTLGKLSKEYNLDIEVLREQLKSLKPMDELAKEIFQKQSKIPEKRTNFDKFCEKVLYYMMNDLKYIKIYQYQLGFFENKVYRTIANEIVYYAGKHGNINVADFISYIEANEEVSADAIRIASTEEDLSEESLQGYIKAINKKTKEDQINKLRIELKQELDKAKKLDIAKRITEIKKGSV